MPGNVTGVPKLLLRLEGLCVLFVAVSAYATLSHGWTLFFLLFLVPDLGMLGYLAGRNAGAVLYNMTHWYGVPLALIGFGIVGHFALPLAFGLIWAAHIGFDRALGYGLKYVDGFGFTHLGSPKIGLAAEGAQGNLG
jgi:hypothetical protein